MAGEAIIVPILIDPKAGVSGLKAFGNAAVETGAKMTAANTGSKLFGDGIKGLGKNLLAVNPLWGIGVAAVTTFVTSLLSGSDAVNSFSEANKAAAQSIAGDMVKLTTLVGLIQNVNASQTDRTKALSVLNTEYGKYLSNMDSEKITLDNISKAYDQIIDSLLRQALIKGAQKEIEAAVAESAAKILDITRKQQIETEKLNKKNAEKGTIDQNVLNKMQAYNRAASDGIAATAGQNKQIDKSIDKLDIYAAQIETLKNKLRKDLEPLFNITANFSDLDIKDPKVPKTPKVKVPKVEVKPERIVLDFNQAGTGEFNKQVDQFLKFMFDKDVKFDFKAPELFPPEEAKQQGLEFSQMFGKEVDAYFNQNKVIDPSLENAEKNYADAKKAAAELLAMNVQLSNQITGYLTPATDAFIDALLSRGDALQAFFQGIRSAIGQLIKQIVAAIAQAAILSLLTGGAAGGGLSLRGALKKITGLAAGGLVTGPVSALVGEGAGTNRSNPEVIAPLDKLKNFFASMTSGRGAGFNSEGMGIAGSMIAVPGNITMRASGRDLMAVLDLETLNRRRTG